MAKGHAPWRKALARADEVERPDLRDDPRMKLPPSRDFH
jgi:error-prone DNA polymerase